MKLDDWNVQPVRRSKRSRRGDEVQVHSIVATNDNKRVILHRVERTLPNGKKEVFLIKASPREMKIDH